MSRLFVAITLCGLLVNSICCSQPAGDDVGSSAEKNPSAGGAEAKKAKSERKPVHPKEIAELMTAEGDPARQYAAGSTSETSRVGEDWAQFLGSRQNGISGETGLLEEWPKEGPPVIWEMTTGTGYSAPAIRGNFLVIHHRVKNEEVVECMTADGGKPVWKYAYPSQYRDPYGYNNGPRCAPVLTETRCYTFGAEGKLLCVELQTGKKVWVVDTAKEWQVPEAFFGVGSTPLLVGKVLFVMVGGYPKAGVVAFHAETGEVLWEAVSKKSLEAPDGTFDLDDKITSYSSLVIAPIHGKQHLLAFLRDGLVSLEPESGAENFQYFFRSRSFESVNAASPLVVGNEILLSAAYRTGAVLLRVKESGKEFDVVWKNRNLETHWSTPLPLKGHIVGFSGRHENEAMFRCLNLETGEIVWETDGLPKGDDKGGAPAADQYYGRGSAILADGKLIVLGERGVLALVAADPEKFREISRVKYPKMGYPSWAAPVLSRGRLYLRCEDYLMCVDLKKTGV